MPMPDKVEFEIAAERRMQSQYKYSRVQALSYALAMHHPLLYNQLGDDVLLNGVNSANASAVGLRQWIDENWDVDWEIRDG
jgi:hypothetical protein